MTELPYGTLSGMVNDFMNYPQTICLGKGALNIPDRALEIL